VEEQVMEAQVMEEQVRYAKAVAAAVDKPSDEVQDRGIRPFWNLHNGGALPLSGVTRGAEQ